MKRFPMLYCDAPHLIQHIALMGHVECSTGNRTEVCSLSTQSSIPSHDGPVLYLVDHLSPDPSPFREYDTGDPVCTFPSFLALYTHSRLSTSRSSARSPHRYTQQGWSSTPRVPTTLQAAVPSGMSKRISLRQCLFILRALCSRDNSCSDTHATGGSPCHIHGARVASVW